LSPSERGQLLRAKGDGASAQAARHVETAVRRIVGGGQTLKKRTHIAKARMITASQKGGFTGMPQQRTPRDSPIRYLLAGTIIWEKANRTLTRRIMTCNKRETSKRRRP